MVRKSDLSIGETETEIQPEDSGDSTCDRDSTARLGVASTSPKYRWPGLTISTCLHRSGGITDGECVIGNGNSDIDGEELVNKGLVSDIQFWLMGLINRVLGSGDSASDEPDADEIELPFRLDAWFVDPWPYHIPYEDFSLVYWTSGTEYSPDLFRCNRDIHIHKDARLGIFRHGSVGFGEHLWITHCARLLNISHCDEDYLDENFEYVMEFPEEMQGTLIEKTDEEFELEIEYLQYGFTNLEEISEQYDFENEPLLWLPAGL